MKENNWEQEGQQQSIKHIKKYHNLRRISEEDFNEWERSINESSH